MNLRILKKLSKRAAPYMEDLGCTWKQFDEEVSDCYTSMRGHDRKHWDRYCLSYRPPECGRDIHITPRRGDWTILVSERSICPWPGTVMLGRHVGCLDPEWEEDDAWSLLKRAVCAHWETYIEIPGDYDELGSKKVVLVSTRRLRSPSAILRALPEVIESRRKDVAANEVQP